MRERPIGVIGAGRLGASLAAGLRGAGYRLSAVASAREPSARTLVEALGAGVEVMDARALVERCDVVFLTVPDGAIEAMAVALAWRPGQAAVHCSGTLGLDVLAAATEAGATAGCLHPLQSFPSRAPQPERFRGVVCGIEAPEPLGAELEAVARDLEAHVVRLEGVDRARYHAAAVFASNYVVALASAAGRAWTFAGLPPSEARTALAPLMRAAATNLGTLDLAEALTGPVARGDVDTVVAHLAALAADPALAELYRLLGAELLRLPLEHPPEVSERLQAVFGTSPPPFGHPLSIPSDGEGGSVGGTV